MAFHFMCELRAKPRQLAIRALIKPTKARHYASQTSLGTTANESRSRRQTVTVFNDDGKVKWGDLSVTEKAARATQSSFYSTVIGAGLLGTIVVFAFLYTDVFSSDSSITQYNHIVDRVRSDPECIAILGPSKEISALGDPTGTSWIRSRPKAITETDKFGVERMQMKIRMSGPRNTGFVHMLMLRRQDEKHWHYGQLYLDVPGQNRIWLEKGEQSKKKKAPTQFLGLRWG